MRTVILLILGGVFFSAASIGHASDDFPACVPDDAIMAGPGLAREISEWAAAAFRGIERPEPRRIAVELRRQDHGVFAFDKSCIGTAPLRIGAQSFAHGLGTHANSEIAVSVPPGARAFKAQIGIDNNNDTAGARGSVQFAVELDGREVFHSDTLRGGNEPVPLEVELPTGVKQLVLKVDTTPDGPAYDQADWCEAHFVMADGSAAWLHDRQADRLLMGDVPPFSFHYGGKASAEFLSRWEQKCETSEQPDRIEHRVRWLDPQTRLSVTAVVTTYPRYGAVDWVLYFENHGTTDTPLIEDIQALDVRLETAAGQQDTVLHQIKGDTCGADTFLPFDTPLVIGSNLKISPVGGRSSNRSFPFMNFEAGGRGLIVAIGWSGQWAAELARDTAATRFRAGMEKTHLKLHPGERIRSPRILLLAWRGDRRVADNRFRRLMLFHYVPQQDGHPVRPPVAVQCFDRYSRRVPEWATETGQLRYVQVAQQIGCDTVWLDAAWFPGNFPNGVGNWTCKPEEFPRGLKPVADACHERGLKFMLWFEPERVAPNTQIAREHPEFLYPGDSGGLSGGLFNLGDPKARRFLTDLLANRIAEYGLDVYRNDFNIDPLGFWRANDEPDREGMNEIRYIEGLYEMWDELRIRHPGLLIDNCASGGRRIDLEMCMRSVPMWRSDTGCSSNPVHWNQVQCCGLSQYVPLHAVASWTPAAYDVRSVASAGVACQWDYLSEQFPVEMARAAVAEARENQKFWIGDFYPLLPVTLANEQWAAYQFHRADLDAGIVLVFRRGGSSYTGLDLALRGLNADATYDLEFVDEAREKTTQRMMGRQLASGTSLRIELPRRGTSMLVRYVAAAMKSSEPVGSK